MRSKKHMAFQHEVVSSKNKSKEAVDYKLQGNPEFYKKSAIRKREKLFSSKLIEGQILNFWNTYKLKSNSLLSKQLYLRVHMLMSKALDPKFSKSKALITAMLDWRHDCKCREIVSSHAFNAARRKEKLNPELEKELRAQVQEWERKEKKENEVPVFKRRKPTSLRDQSGEGLTLWQFKRSMFEIVDKWTDSIDEMDYARFLFRLYARVTVSYKGQEKQRQWKSLTEVSPISRADLLEPLKNAEEEIINQIAREMKIEFRKPKSKRSGVRSRSTPVKGNRYNNILRNLFKKLRSADGTMDDDFKELVLEAIRGVDHKMINTVLDPLTRESALHIAVSSSFTEAVELLLSRNAEVNCKDLKGNTPLSCAFDAMAQARRTGDHNKQAQCFRIMRLLQNVNVEEKQRQEAEARVHSSHDDGRYIEDITTCLDAADSRRSSELSLDLSLHSQGSLASLATEKTQTSRKIQKSPSDFRKNWLGSIGTLKGQGLKEGRLRSHASSNHFVRHIEDENDHSNPHVKHARSNAHIKRDSGRQSEKQKSPSSLMTVRGMNSSPLLSGRSISGSDASTSTPRMSRKGSDRRLRGDGHVLMTTPWGSDAAPRARGRTREISPRSKESFSVPPRHNGRRRRSSRPSKGLRKSSRSVQAATTSRRPSLEEKKSWSLHSNSMRSNPKCSIRSPGSSIPRKDSFSKNPLLDF